MAIETNSEESVKQKLSIGHIQILWWIQIVVVSMYLLANLIVDANMQLPNLGPKMSLFIIVGLTALGVFDAICLLFIDKKRAWISIFLLLMYVLFSIPALI